MQGVSVFRVSMGTAAAGVTAVISQLVRHLWVPMSHGTPHGNAGHPKILAAPTSDHSGARVPQGGGGIAGLPALPAEDLRGDCAFSSAPGRTGAGVWWAKGSWKGQCSLGHQAGPWSRAGVLPRTRQGSPQPVPSKLQLLEAEEQPAIEPLAQAPPVITARCQCRVIHSFIVSSTERELLGQRGPAPPGTCLCLYAAGAQ